MDQLKEDIHYRAGYLDPSPYPAVEVSGPNPCYAALLQEDYAGQTSEFTAVNQYLYHHMAEDAPDVREMMEKVAIVEMMHMEKLGKAIRLLGGDPRYQAEGKMWSAEDVSYGVTLLERLHQDLASEYAAIENYQRHIAQIRDPKVCALLQRVILDEKVHVGLFKKAIARYEG